MVPSLATAAGTMVNVANLAGLASSLVPFAGLGLAGASLGIGAIGYSANKEQYGNGSVRAKNEIE